MADSLFSVSEPLSPTSSSLKEKKNNSKGPPMLGFPLGKGSKHPQETSMSLHILSPPPPRHQSRESRKQPDICEDVTGSWLLCRGVAVLWNTPKVTYYGRYREGSVVCTCENGCLPLNFDTYKEPPFKVHHFPATLAPCSLIHHFIGDFLQESLINMHSHFHYMTQLKGPWLVIQFNWIMRMFLAQFLVYERKTKLPMMLCISTNSGEQVCP